jgi:hypothetical protein
VIVLFVLIAIAVTVAVLLGMSMCRLAARSDENQAAAWAEWRRAFYLTEHKAAAPALPPEQSTFDPRGEAFGAAG